MTHPEYCIVRAQQMASTSEGRSQCCPSLQPMESLPFVWLFSIQRTKAKTAMRYGIGYQSETIARTRCRNCYCSKQQTRQHHPGGPQCTFNGKIINCLTFCSESGDITTEILIKVLKHFDEKEVFPSIPGDPILFLLVDGCNNTLDPPLVDYIYAEHHCWKVCLGVSYAT